MAEVIRPNFTSAKEQEREEFERWAGSQLRLDEITRYFSRTVGGEYTLPVTKAAWAAWQARGLFDSGEPFFSGHRIT